LDSGLNPKWNEHNETQQLEITNPGGRVPNPTLQFGGIQNLVADCDAQKQTPFTGKWGKIISGDTLDSVSWHGMGVLKRKKAVAH